MDALALLDLQLAWGAGAAVSSHPVDRFRPTPPAPHPAPPANTAVSAPPVPAASVPAASVPAASVRPGPAAPARTPAPPAAAPASLTGLCARIAAFDCPLRATVTTVVAPAGPDAPRFLIVGEVPDGDADASGLPYAGLAGTTLAAWLASAGLDRSQAVVMSALPWRPPGARPPTAAEEAAARPFVQELLALHPGCPVLALGPIAARMVLDGGAKPGATVVDGGRAVLVVPGVADCARRPGLKRLVWAGLRRLVARLDERSRDRPAKTSL